MIDRLFDWLRSHQSEMRADLRTMVELESPSSDPVALARCAAFIAERARSLSGGQVRVVEDPQGQHLDIAAGTQDRSPVLLLGHYDTVWPVGTLAERPYTEDDGIARGPGVFDMKAGLVQGLWALRALAAVRGSIPATHFFINSDEEVQSARSRQLVVAAAREARAVLVLEPSQDGALKTSRKGAGRFEIVVRGRAAHAGVAPDAGRSAISEIAHIISFVDGLADVDVGTTLNVGTVQGGTRPNVVAAEARVEVDVRVARQAEADRITRILSRLAPTREGIAIEVRGEFGRPPMERSPATAELFALARSMAISLGSDLREVATGGASDANLCAALGVPVLDGLGAVGGGAHAADEYVMTDAMPVRAALVAGLIHQMELHAGEIGHSPSSPLCPILT